MRKKIIMLFGAVSAFGLYSCDPTGVESSKQNEWDDAAIHAAAANGSLAAKNSQLTKLGEGFGFTEGPATDAFGNVFFTDQPNNKIVRWDASSGTLTTFVDNSGRSNGMYFDKDGNLITCADMNGEIWSIDKDGNHTVLVDNYNGKILNGPNDLWINPINGGMYVTDPLYKRGFWADDDPRKVESQQGGGFVYYLSPDRQTFTRVAGEDFDQSDLSGDARILPNGIVGTPDGKKLYVAHIWPEETYVYDINEDGSLSNRKLFVAMRSDGLTIDLNGNVYLTNEHGVTAFNPNGEQVFNVPTNEGWTANVTFGGPNRKTLFVTALGRVYGLDMKVKGVK